MFRTATANTTKATSSNSSLFQKEKGDHSFIQPKLNIGKPGDKYEVEADKVADTIVSKGNDQSNSFFSPAPIIQKQSEEEVQKQEITENTVLKKPLVEHISPLVQPQAEEEVQKKSEEEVQKKEAIAETVIQEKTDSTTASFDIQKQEEIQEKEEEEEEVQAVQTKINTAVSSSLPDRQTGGVENASIESRLNSSKGGGSPLPKDAKTQMESGFGTDFSNVRVHTDSNAKQMSQDLGAQAFTHGNDIYFNEGKFDTASSSGKHLLAHELTHTVQQGGGIKRKATDVSPAPEMIQGSFLDWIPDWILDNARHIPGYLLFTVIIQYDPLLGQRVEPTPVNLMRGLMGLVPFGVAIFDKLQEYGIIQRVFDWVSGRLSELNLTTRGLLDLVEETWENNPIASFIGALREEFNNLVSRITTFATSLVDQIITWIKEALIDVAEPILEENRAWSLIKKIIHYDPLRDEEVTATTVEILEDFLMLIGKETELEQMRERGTLQETADWLDTQVGAFMSLLGELRGLINAAWEAIRPANLTEIATNLTALSGRVTGFLERVWAFATTVAIEVLKIIKKALLSWLSSVANETRGFSLVKVIIGKDPFTDEAVPRTVPNLIRGFMSLMDGGEEQYAQMVETGAIARITGEIEAAVETLNMTPQSIVQLFIDLWNSFTIDDLLNPIDAFIRIVDRFGEPIGRLIAFVAEIVRIVIVAILEIMNFPFDLIQNIITRSLQAIDDIKRDPIGFLKNILRAIKEGFVKFFDNIVTHLINGVMGWLMRELRDAGIPELTDFSLQGVISWVLEVLGISMERIWEKLAEHPRIGPQRVARIRGAINTLEGIWTFIKDVQERGIAAIWDKIQEQLSNLWNIVIDAVKNFVMTRIITQITTRLLSMLDPTGIMAVVNGAMAFFNAVQSFIQYLREMLEVINSFVNGVADVARGNVATAADYLERTMGQSMPVVIGFLANQVGLGGIGSRIAEIIGSVRALIDEALTWLVNRAVDTGMALLDRVMGRSAPLSEEEGTPMGGDEGNFEVSSPVRMQTASHSLKGLVVNGRLEFVLHSDPVILEPTLIRILNEMPSNNPNRDILENALAEVREIETDYSANENEILRGVTANTVETRRAAKEAYILRRQAQITNQLEIAARTFNITELNAFFRTPPSQRYIPSSSPGTFIRTNLYDNLHSWTTFRNNYMNTHLPNIKTRIRNAQTNGNLTEWQLLKTEGKIEDDANISNYNPDSISYALDHRTSVAQLWNSGGFNTDDRTRELHFLNPNNLQIMTQRQNSSKGSGGIQYKKFVGLNFVSSLADGGVNNAIRINGQPFLDSENGNPIT
ncbi:DUF4157 domain-containing protein [Aquimarina sp. SS2-1]|uniref:eCIS core domain-containing protein n=1 Tax=Aquimarina besae TaxID=3342247 RepID=UPI00366B5D04